MTSTCIAALPVAHIRLSGPLTGEVLLRRFAPLLDGADADRSNVPIIVSCTPNARLRPTGTGVLFRTVLDLFSRNARRLLVVVGAPEPLRMTLEGLFRQIDRSRRAFFVDTVDAACVVVRLHDQPNASPPPLHPPPPVDPERLPVPVVTTLAA